MQHDQMLYLLSRLQLIVHEAPAFHSSVIANSPLIGSHMLAHARFTILALSALFCSVACAELPINIFFSNHTRYDYTIKPSYANFCIDKYDTDSFTVAAGAQHTYYAALQSNCTDATISFDYSQTIRPRLSRERPQT